jgi:uncharacterized protein YjbI with pentapeptide repeats
VRAILVRANLTGARLEGADLSGVKGLTYDQVELADVDEGTKLPASFRY